MKEATGIIPVRYQTTRILGKPLALILGKPMIQWVYERTRKSKFLQNLIVAIDDKRIYKECQKFGADVRMTSPHHVSGTERIELKGNKQDPTLNMKEGIVGDYLYLEYPFESYCVSVLIGIYVQDDRNKKNPD